MRIVVDCHGHHLISNMLLLQLVWLLCCYGLHCVEPIFYWRQMYCTMLWGRLFLTKKYGTYSTVFPAILLSFFFMEVKCKSNKFYWRCIDWIEWNVKLFTFHDEADGQTHVHYHCVVVVVLWILATACNAHSNQEAHEAMMSADAYDDTILLCNWTRLSINKERCMPVANQMVVFWLSWWSCIAIDSRTNFWWWSDLASSAIDFLPHFSCYWTIGGWYWNNSMMFWNILY